MPPPLLLLALCALPACRAPLVQDAPVARFTLDDVFELGTKLRPKGGASLGWLADGGGYLTVEGEGKDRAIAVVDAATGEKRPLFAADRMEAAFAALPGIPRATAAEWSRRPQYEFSRARDAVLLNESNDLFVYGFKGERAARLTADPEEETDESFSPDGRLVAFVRESNLWVAPVEGGAPRALTTEGGPDRLVGRLDWVYQEEVYGRGNFRAYWWSPDSARIAFLVLEQSPVPEFTIVGHGGVHPNVEKMRYPKAGDPNPRAKIAVVSVAGGPARAFDLGAYSPEDSLIVRVGWSPDSKEVVFQVQNRIQSWLDLLAGDPATGKVRKLFRDETGVWIEPTDAPFWIEQGKRFLWLSERDGFRHLYLYDRDGKLERRLTEGPWEVDEVHGVDEKAGRVYFDSDREDVKGSDLFRVNLDGTGLERITRTPGTHRISLSPDFGHFLDGHSTASDPGGIEVFRAGGEPVRQVDRVDSAALAAHGFVAPEFVRVKTRDGFEMEAMMIKPPGFAPGRGFPVLCYAYAGPHAPSVRDAWGGFTLLFHEMLAQEGFLVWICDNRSASGKGLRSAAGVYRNFGVQELADIEDGIEWLVAQGIADPSRVGIWGWSFGGYITAFALTHSKRFKIGIAGAPVTDWRYYDSIYTERYMDLPQANEEGYKRSSAVEAAGELSGRLLLIHGTIDENVHVQNTLELARALEEAGKRFDLMLYPGNRHGVSAPKQRRHLYEMVAQFVRENL